MTVVSAWLSLALTVLAIVIVMNAVNFIDGLDGLVAGVCLISNGIFFVYSYLPRPATPAPSTYFNLASFIAGGPRGRLPRLPAAELEPGEAVHGRFRRAGARPAHGVPPPIAITGADEPGHDGRSRRSSRPPPTAPSAFLPILLPVVIVLLPLLDFGLAVVRRMRRGKSPFSPDRKHLHHRMLDMGHS